MRSLGDRDGAALLAGMELSDLIGGQVAGDRRPSTSDHRPAERGFVIRGLRRDPRRQLPASDNVARQANPYIGVVPGFESQQHEHWSNSHSTRLASV